MAEQAPISEGSRGVTGGGSGLAGLVVLPFLAVATLVAKVWHGITSDGTLAAAGRQGADELGAALKAFPESIQVQETGTIFNPTQGEVAAGRQYGRHTGSYTSYSASSQPPHPWPSEVANDHRHQPGNDHGHDNGHEHSM